jgi:hypothetical protein
MAGSLDKGETQQPNKNKKGSALRRELENQRSAKRATSGFSSRE